MRPPRLPSSGLFQTPPFTVLLATVAAIVLMFFLVAGGSPSVASSRLAIEREVYRALIDSVYTQPVDSGSGLLRDVMLEDHFAGVGDTIMWRYMDEWLRDSGRQLPVDARTDFRDRNADTRGIRLLISLRPMNKLENRHSGGATYVYLVLSRAPRRDRGAGGDIDRPRAVSVASRS